jgi:thioredoxin 2
MGAVVRAVPHGDPGPGTGRRRPGRPGQLVKVNVDESPKIAQRYGVQAIPTLLVLRNGQVAARRAGAAPAADLRAWVEAAIRP